MEADDIGRIQSCLLDGMLQPKTRQLLGGLVDFGPGTTVDRLVAILRAERARNVHVSNVNIDGGGVYENPISCAYDVWTALTASPDPATSQVIQINLLSAPVVLCLLAALRNHFDLEHLLATFTKAGPHSVQRPLPGSPSLRASTWFFSLKYYYADLDRPTYTDQQKSPLHRKHPGRYIFRGSAVVALRLSDGAAIGAKGQENYSVNSSAVPKGSGTPWRLLVLSTKNVSSPGQYGGTSNGFGVFLCAVSAELHHARRCLRALSHMIASTAVPSDDFLFDQKLQESLLFEDETFANAKTYFWALEALRIINESITSLITVWRLFRSELEPYAPHPPTTTTATTTNLSSSGTASSSSSSNNGIVTAAAVGTNKYLVEIEEHISKLEEVLRDNACAQDSIRALRDGLLSATAVLEARTAVAQGTNVRALTLVSMVFLPASFSTSIFGMQVLSSETTSVYTFAIVMSVLCGLTYLVILKLGAFSWRFGMGGVVGGFGGGAGGRNGGGLPR